MNEKYCFLIPVYNHGRLLKKYIGNILRYNIKIVIIDDGSDKETKKYLEDIQAENKDIVSLITTEKNMGKGHAFKKGIEYCYLKKIEYAFQIDADGQHDSKEIESFLNESMKNTNCLIASYPVYDNSVVAIRKYGRKITNFLAAIETLSLDIKDALLGFRIYPVKQTYEVIKNFKIAEKMAFDLDIIVRLHRAGTKMIFLPVGVVYPKDGVSHFNLFYDNIHIAKKHINLMLDLVFDFYKILKKKHYK